MGCVGSIHAPSLARSLCVDESLTHTLVAGGGVRVCVSSERKCGLAAERVAMTMLQTFIQRMNGWRVSVGFGDAMARQETLSFSALRRTDWCCVSIFCSCVSALLLCIFSFFYIMFFFFRR